MAGRQEAGVGAECAALGGERTRLAAEGRESAGVRAGKALKSQYSNRVGCIVFRGQSKMKTWASCLKSRKKCH